MKKPEQEKIVVHMRETYEAQLPLIAAILATAEEEFDPKQAAKDAIELVLAIEEELEQ